MHSIVLAYICFPEVQKKLQEEVDRVIGRDRLPHIEDVQNLPYTRAFVREALRWRGPTRFSLPHATSEEDTYMGYYIPKGATWVSLPAFSSLPSG
jgi:cytochrome P450